MRSTPKPWRELDPEDQAAARFQFENDRTLAQLRTDAVVAFDRLEELKHKYGRASLKLWILTGVTIAEASMIGWLATQLFARLH